MQQRGGPRAAPFAFRAGAYAWGMPARTVAHVDMDAFYVSVELLRRPELRGLPVVVAGSGPRAVVTTASYEARRFGVGSATPASRARRLCPQAVFIAPDFEAYRASSRQVMAIVREVVSTVEVAGLDEAYLELTGVMSPHAEMRRLQGRIRAESGLTCSIGIGPNKLVAKVASDAEKPAGFVALSRAEACARFASSPPGLIPGIGPRTQERLTELGVTTLAQLAVTPVETLRAAFGPRLGDDLRRRARFEHDGAVTEERIAVSESRERTFDCDIRDRAEQEAFLDGMAGELCAALQKQGRRGRTIGIKVRLDDFTTITRARTLDEPVNDAARVALIARELLRDYDPPRPVRLLGVRLAGFEDAAARPDDQLALPV